MYWIKSSRVGKPKSYETISEVTLYWIKSSRVGKPKSYETIEEVLVEVERILRDRVGGIERGKIIIERR